MKMECIQLHEAVSQGCSVSELQQMCKRNKWSIKDLTVGNYKVFEACAQRGDLEVLQWINTEFSLVKLNATLNFEDYDDGEISPTLKVIYICASHKRRAMVAWIMTYVPYGSHFDPGWEINIYVDLFENCVSEGRLNILEWMEEEFGLVEQYSKSNACDVSDAIGSARYYRHYDVIAWIAVRFELQDWIDSYITGSNDKPTNGEIAAVRLLIDQMRPRMVKAARRDT